MKPTLLHSRIQKDSGRARPVLGWILIGAALILWSCSAGQPRSTMDVERIRQNAEQAHADLSTEEGGAGPSITPQTGQSSPHSVPVDTAPVSEAPLETGARPDWIERPDGRFAQQDYMTGVGYGPERTAAEDRARSEIAKIFKSDIASENRTYEEYLQSSEGDRSQAVQNFNFEDITTVSTRKVLSGTRIAAVYREATPQTGFYALAVLDRNHMSPILTEKIGLLDQEIDHMLAIAQNETDHLTKVRAYKTGIETYVLRQAYNTELRIVRSDGRGIPPRYTLADIQQQFTRILLKDFAVMVSVQGDRAAEVQQALTEALNQKGFAVSSNSGRAAVFARGLVQIEPIEQGNSQWKFVRWKAYFDLVDRQGGMVFGSVQKSGKEGHISLAEAEERAVRKIRQVMTQDISKDLTGYILAPVN